MPCPDVNTKNCTDADWNKYEMNNITSDNFSGDFNVGSTVEGESLARKAYHWYFFAVSCVFIFPTIIGNSLILITLLRFQSLRKNKAYILVGNLALSDLLVGLVAMPMDMLPFLFEELSHSVTFCTVQLSFIYTLMGLSVVNLFLLSLERFDSVVYPFEHGRRFTSNRIYVTIVCTWILMALFGFLPTYFMKDIKLTLKTFQCRTRTVFPVLYRKLFHSIVLLCLFLCTVFFVVVVRIATSAMNGFRAVDCGMRRRQLKKDLRHTRNMLIITGLFIGFWAPFCVVSLIPNPSETVLFVRQWLSSFGVINSCLNWVVYGVRCQKFRAAFLGVLNCKCTHPEYKLPSTSL